MITILQSIKKIFIYKKTLYIIVFIEKYSFKNIILIQLLIKFYFVKYN